MHNLSLKILEKSLKFVSLKLYEPCVKSVKFLFLTVLSRNRVIYRTLALQFGGGPEAGFLD